jgi:hypothetical protein
MQRTNEKLLAAIAATGQQGGSGRKTLMLDLKGHMAPFR